VSRCPLGSTGANRTRASGCWSAVAPGTPRSRACLSRPERRDRNRYRRFSRKAPRGELELVHVRVGLGGAAADGRGGGVPSGRWIRSGALFPRASNSSGELNMKPGPAACAIRSLHTISQLPAPCWSLAARFTASPVTRKSLRSASMAATTSPVLSPTRIGSRSPRPGSSRTWSRNASAAAAARPASSSWAVGRPNTAMTASPMNFSVSRRGPPPPLRRWRNKRPQRRARMSSRSSSSPIAVEPVTSANNGDGRRSSVISVIVPAGKRLPKP
jgi:hypothetical protein